MDKESHLTRISKFWYKLIQWMLLVLWMNNQTTLKPHFNRKISIFLMKRKCDFFPTKLLHCGRIVTSFCVLNCEAVCVLISVLLDCWQKLLYSEEDSEDDVTPPPPPSSPLWWAVVVCSSPVGCISSSVVGCKLLAAVFVTETGFFLAMLANYFWIIVRKTWSIIHSKYLV